MPFLDLFSDKSDLYASARPTYPEELYRFVASAAPAHRRAWDCATGSGQAAVGLATVFDAVEATDASDEQIRHAKTDPRIRYSVQPAEATKFADESFDAICVAQALHWFDLDRFYAEAMRVLATRGVLVAWGYDWFRVSPQFDEEFERCVKHVIRGHWDPRVAALWNGYREIPFPFDRIETPRLEIRAEWRFAQLLAYVHSWSATRRCIDAEGTAFFERAEAELAHAWGPAETTRTVRMPLHILAGRRR